MQLRIYQLVVASSTTATVRPFEDARQPQSADELELDSLATRARSASSQSVASAQATLKAVLESYWDALGQPFPMAEPPVSIGGFASDRTSFAEDIASRFGASLAELPPGNAALRAGSLYTSLLPDGHRSMHGVFYTPSPLAHRLLDSAESAGVDWSTARVIDPSSGAGSFLLPAAERIISAVRSESLQPEERASGPRLEGWELDEFACWLSRVFIDALLHQAGDDARDRIDVRVKARDSLHCAATDYDTYDLVIGNPPFGRRRLDPTLRKRFAESLFGHANLYGLFTELSARLATDQGTVALLLPASFLAGEYFKNLRRFLGAKCAPTTLEFVEARKGVFDGVLQETVLATFRKGRTSKVATARTLHLDRGAAHAVEAGSFALPDELARPWLVPRTPEDAAVVDAALQLPNRLSDWGYSVSTGPLVWNRHKNQLTCEPADGAVPVVWAEAVGNNGELQLRYSKRNHFPFLSASLPKDKWLLTSRPCVLVQRTTAKEQSRRLIAAPMEDELLSQHPLVSVENHLNMVLPNSTSPKVSLRALSAVLNSRAADRVFRCASGSVAVSAFELENLPLPPPESLRTLETLLVKGDDLDSLDRECSKLFGLE